MIADPEATVLYQHSAWDCPIPDTHLQTILESAGDPSLLCLSLLDSFGQTRARNRAAWSITRRSIGEHDSCTERAPILVGGTIVAHVEATGPADMRSYVALAANLTAARITDAWLATQEIASLAGEVVHAYEELHVLYELGEALTGYLTLTQVADMLLEKISNTLQPLWAELRFTDGQAPLHVRCSALLGQERTAPSNTDHSLRTTLRIGGEILGEIRLARPAASEPFSSADGKLLDAVGALAGSALRNAQLFEELRRQADTDALTGLYNHRAFQEQLDLELARAAERDHPLAVLMIDIDDFKLFNDTYGHGVGDQILRLASETLVAACREGDVVARYGGDEFIMLLPETDREGAVQVAQRMLQKLQAHGVRVADHEALPLALSIGCATFPEDAKLKHDLLSHADAALYDTKRAGGNDVGIVPSVLSDKLDVIPTGATFGALQGLVHAVDAKDRYTREHSQLVTQGAVLLARRLGLSAETCGALRIAGLLHDVGKIGIPDRILRKPGRLDPQEYTIMQQHVALSELIIKEVPHLVDVLSAVASHHERFDGRGYPRGLRGEEIPLLGRIMALADACSAMLLSRPYRKGLSWQEVQEELRRGKGTQFDPDLVEPFIQAIIESEMLSHTAPKH